MDPARVPKQLASVEHSSHELALLTAWPLLASEFANPASCKAPGLKTDRGELKVNFQRRHFHSTEDTTPLLNQAPVL